MTGRATARHRATILATELRSVTGGALLPSCAIASVTARWAGARAVVYFTPISVTAPLMPSADARGRWRRSASSSRPRLTFAGTTPRCTSVTSRSPMSSDGKAWLISGRETVELLGRHHAGVGAAGLEPCHVPIDSFPCQGSANSRRPSALGAPQATTGAGRVVTRFSALTSSGAGERRRPPSVVRPPRPWR